MIQCRFKEIQLQLGEKPLFQGISFTINKGDRIAILGRNGAGKSTLMKMLLGDIEPDAGVIERAPHLKIALMAQQVPEASTQTVYAYLDDKYQREHDWETHRIDQVISLLELMSDATIASLSGGQRRRLSLAEAILNEPDILLLDEPTNHLDIDSIIWLENFLLKQSITLIFITHDRAFMQKIAKRIFEIDLARLITWDGDYHGFLKHKAQVLAAEERANELFDKRLAQEEVWIRQGIKARRTRNEGRVRALKAMRAERQQRLTRQSSVQQDQRTLNRSGKVVIEVNDIHYAIDSRVLIDGFSTVIESGDKIGIIGPNGCGKSTLIQILLEQLKPQKGFVKQGTQLEIAVFDQHREELNLEATAIDNVADGASKITINGKDKHVISYLQDFLFTPEKARSQVKSFSGGERNRLLLAKILAKPANFIILDEPTNDLDMETLAFLEEYLMDYPGTLLLVSHDREFLDNVVTSTIVFEGAGHLQEYVGGYEDAMRQSKVLAKTVPVTKPAAQPTDHTVKKSTAKRSYKDERELSLLPDKIERLEQQIQSIQDEMCQPDFYQQPSDVITAKQAELATLEQSLQECYDRWSELEEQ